MIFGGIEEGELFDPEYNAHILDGCKAELCFGEDQIVIEVGIPGEVGACFLIGPIGFRVGTLLVIGIAYVVVKGALCNVRETELFCEMVKCLGVLTLLVGVVIGHESPWAEGDAETQTQHQGIDRNSHGFSAFNWIRRVSASTISAALL